MFDNHLPVSIRKQLEEQITELKRVLNEQECKMKKTSVDSAEKEKSFLAENNDLKQQLNHKDKMLKEYQSQVLTFMIWL